MFNNVTFQNKGWFDVTVRYITFEITYLTFLIFIYNVDEF